MKKIITLLIIVGGPFASFAQYNFSTTTGTYSDLVSPTSITNGATWDDPEYAMPIGFNFQYFDSTINQIFIEDLGLGGFLSINNLETGVTPSLNAYGADIIDRGYSITSGPATTGGLSPISYLLSGAVGTRIFKVEWKNVGFYSEIADDGISSDFTNFQLWFYEGSNDIEIHFGPNNIVQTSLCFDGQTGTTIELNPNENFTTSTLGPNSINLIGNPTSPVIQIINSYDSIKNLNGIIPNGTIYKFTKTGGTVSVDETKKEFKTTIFPNPANDFIHVASTSQEQQIASVQVIDVQGKVVKTIVQNFNQIDVNELKSGVYIVKTTTTNGLTANNRFVKN